MKKILNNGINLEGQNVTLSQVPNLKWYQTCTADITIINFIYPVPVTQTQ